MVQSSQLLKLDSLHSISLSIQNSSQKQYNTHLTQKYNFPVNLDRKKRKPIQYHIFTISSCISSIQPKIHKKKKQKKKKKKRKQF